MNDQEQKCQCDFRIRMLGDGCRYCQPQEYIDRLHDTMDGMIHADCLELTELTSEERKAIWIGIWNHYSCPSVDDIFAEIEEAILRKAQEK